MNTLAEPALLGFSSGLVCLAACGPVLLPWLTAAGGGWRSTAALLALFLAGRLLGYCGFATAAWAIGLALPLPVRSNALMFAAVHLALATALLLFAVSARRVTVAGCPHGQAVSRRAALARRFRSLAPVVLGLLTGINLCPPFVAAGVRAAQRHNLPDALGFFLLFFAGTTIWFLPFVGVAALRRFSGIGVVARLTSAVVATYYGYIGAVALGGVLLHG